MRMKANPAIWSCSICGAALAALAVLPSFAFAQDQADLAKASQNPVAAMISLPFQNNTFFGVGPGRRHGKRAEHPAGDPDRYRARQSDQPDDRAADLPARRHRGPGRAARGRSRAARPSGSATSTTRAFCRPRQSGDITWGIGPSISIPTATDEKLGSEKWSAGPSAVALVTPGPWVVGTLVRQLWSFAGDDDRQDVSQMLIQPFVNYNMAGGWFLTSAPIITANWEASSDNTWLVPLGGGGGRVFKIGPQPVNVAPGLLQRREAALRPRLVFAVHRRPPVPEVSDSADPKRGRPAHRAASLKPQRPGCSWRSLLGRHRHRGRKRRA